MPNHLDFLQVLDEATRDGHGAISTGAEMYQLAADAGLADWGTQTAAGWVGELVFLGYLTHGPTNGPRRPPEHAWWSDGDLQSVTDYRLTKDGRAEAERIRRRAREQQTDAAIGGASPRLTRPWMTEAQRHAITDPLRVLRTALDQEHPSTAIGAAKNLVEAACKIVLEYAGEDIPSDASLPALFKKAARTAGDDPDADLGRSVTATVQRLAELRNTAGAGHGHERLPELTGRHGRLAAAAATGVADFLLNSS